MRMPSKNAAEACSCQRSRRNGQKRSLVCHVDGADRVRRAVAALAAASGGGGGEGYFNFCDLPIDLHLQRPVL
jgi:hypothetical protein